MAWRIGGRWPVVIFVVASLALGGLAGLPWKKDAASGSMGTSEVFRMGLASYELKAGDSIVYDFEASQACWFTITTDPVNPEIGEKLNISGTHGSGQFKSPSAGTYVVQTLFQGPVAGSIATVDYSVYALDQVSRVLGIAKPALIAAPAILIVSIIAVARSQTRGAQSDERKREIDDFWHYFASKIVNWIAVVAGGVMVIAAAIIDSANVMHSSLEPTRFWLYYVGAGFVYWGMMLGMLITYPKHVDDFKRRSQERILAIQRAQRLQELNK